MCKVKVYYKGKEKIKILLLIAIKVDVHIENKEKNKMVSFIVTISDVYWKLNWDLVGSFSFNL